jgi:glycogen debranching enzyme
MNQIIEECYQKSVELLVKNSSKFGILASDVSLRAQERKYLNIFARDAAICSLGMTVSGNKKLMIAAKKSLLTLSKFQAENGQIPNYVKPETNHVNFWHMGCIDATLWWLIAIKNYNKYSGEKVKLEVGLKNKVKKAINWLSCQEHPISGLLIQNEASDWADVMFRTGKVLYSNVLWSKIKSLYKIKDAPKTKDSLNEAFFPFDKKSETLPGSIARTGDLIRAKEENKKCYLSFVDYYFWGQDTDVYANSLLLLFDIPPKKTQKEIINYLEKRKNKKFPMPVLLDPIKKDSKYWRDYMGIFDQNYPHQYHNGGIWPFASCFWSMVLLKNGKRKAGMAELEKIAEFNKNNNWEFNEWFHGLTGKPMGMSGQSWNAGMFVVAYHYFKNKKFI